MPDPRLLVATERGVHKLPANPTEPITKSSPVALADCDVDRLVCDAGTPNRLYASAGHAGVFRSEDLGLTWTKVWQPPGSAWVYSILAHPEQSGVVYAGLEPAALWMSEDSGKSWRELDALQRVPDKREWKFFSPRQAHIRAIAIRPGSPEMLYVGLEEGGVYLSDDGGRTFQSRNENLYRDVHTIGPVPGSPNLVLATTGDGLYRSEDHGKTWTQIEQGLTRSYTVPLLIEPEPPHRMFTAAAAAPPPSWTRGPRRADAKMFRSRDGGLTWEEIMKGWPDPQPGMVFCFHRGRVSPSDPPRLFAGTTDGQVFWSADQGDSWHLLATGLPEIYALLLVA